MTASDLLPPRQPAKRASGRKNIRKKAEDAITKDYEGTNLYPGLNDMADALEALPMEIIRHFTLLREIDAKCIVTMPELTRLIKYLFTLPVPSRDAEPALVEERKEVLAHIRQLIHELMPCLEEKMHVAGVAADAIGRHMKRLDYDFNELVVGQDEIPHIVRFGPAEHPAYLPIVTPAEAKMAQSSRSESRREAMAAKKAAAAAAAAQAKADGSEPNGKNSGTESRGGRGTPRPDDKRNGSRAGAPAPKPTTKNITTSSSAPKRRKGGAVDSPVLGGSAQVYTGSPALAAQEEDAVSVKQEYHGENEEEPSNKRSRGAASTASRKRAAVGNGSTPTPGNESSGSGRSSRAAAKAAAVEESSSRGRTRVGRRTAAAASDAEEEAEAEDDEGNGEDNNENEQVYCYCQQVSFGEMVGCDGADCKIEWFHLPCIGLSAPPEGVWFCNDCAKKNASAAVVAPQPVAAVDSVSGSIPLLPTVPPSDR